MKILFFYPDVCSNGGKIQLGIAYISAVLKKGGHQTELIHLTKDEGFSKIFEKMETFNPDLIAFSSTTNQYLIAKKYAAAIKKKFKIPILFGGIHTTLSPLEVLKDKNVDYICIGEGEYPALELVNALEAKKKSFKIKNIWYKKNNKIVKNSLRPLITELDSLPFPDRELFDFKNVLKKFNYTVDVMAGRGCPYSCTYCCNHAIRKLYNNINYVRMRSADNVLEEIDSLVKKYDIKQINFDDDTFTLFNDWTIDFCNKYKKRFNLPFSCNVRVETANEKVFQALKEAGCYKVNIGIEAGDEWLRKNVLKRFMTNEQIIKAFKEAKAAGLKTYSFNMLGFPSETEEMIRETIELNKKIDPDYIQVSIFYPYPKTELYDLCKAKGYLKGNTTKTSYFDSGTTLKLPQLSEDKINKFYKEFTAFSRDKHIKSKFPVLYPIYKVYKKVFKS